MDTGVSVREEIIKKSGWPPHLFDDPEKQPTVVETAKEFVQEVLLGKHLDDVIVLKNGLTKLDMWDAIPQDFLDAVKSSSTVREFLDKLSDERKRELKTRLYYTETGKWKYGKEKELRKDAQGNSLLSVKEKLDEINRRKEISDNHMYVAELRYIDKYRHPTGNDFTRTFLRRDMKDYVSPDEADCMLYWDRFDEGVFVGGHESGSPVHVDQVSWSNVGKNWNGYKVVAIWKYGKETYPFLDDYLRRLFVADCPKEELATLNDACKIVLVEPGDVFLFSGANAHTVMSVGDELSLTAYESLVNLNKVHCEVFVDTATGLHFEECWPDDDTLDDIKQEVVDALEDMQIMIDKGVPPLTRGSNHFRAFEECSKILWQDPFIRGSMKGKGLAKFPKI